MKSIIAFISIYITAFLITFGHAYTTADKTREFAGYTINVGKGTRTTEAFISAMFWPLYVSILAWE